MKLIKKKRKRPRDGESYGLWDVPALGEAMDGVIC